MSIAVHHCANGVDTSFVLLGPAKIALLGIIQGITELLPVSSTAHMRVIPALLGWPDPGSAFSAAMQLAALLAVISYFKKDIFSIASGSVDAIRARDWTSPQFRFALGIVVATVPIVLAGVLLSGTLNACGSPLRSPLLIGLACLAMVIPMAAAELLSTHRRNAAALTLRDAWWIGLAQVGALIPGVSRSGATLAAALALGFKRDDAARVSFVLGVAAIALAGLKEIWTLAHAGLDAYEWSILGIGLVVSSLSAFIAIWGLMRFLSHATTWPLIAYRAVFGLVLTVGAATHWIS